MADEANAVLTAEQAHALAFAFDTSRDAAVAASIDGRIVYANRAAAQALGRELDLLVGERFVDLLPSDARGAMTDAALAVTSRGETARVDWGELTKGGVKNWYACSVSPLRAQVPGGGEGDGAVVGFLALSSDVTEMKKNELRLRRSEQLMVDTQGTAHLGTWEWDVSEPTATWSDELYRIYGLTPNEYTPSYERYLTMVHPDDRQRVVDATNRVFHEHVPYSHDERIFRPDGSIRYLHTWAHPVLDDDGKLVRLVGVCQDITDRKLAEEEVRTLAVDLERRVAERTRSIENSMRDLQAFNAMVSHDLRAPLSVIQLSCEIIKRNAGAQLPPMVTDTLARIERSVVHMTALVTDLLTLAHVGNSALEKTEVDVSALSEEIVSNHRRRTPERDVDVRIEPGLRINGDAALIRTAMENLIGNAWKYSSRVPKAVIEIGAHEVRHAGGEAKKTIYVRDNGAGFDMSEAHRLFAPFERLHKPSEFEGTGVGLAAVHRIVERHGGKIRAESEPGRGATFFIELPAA